MEPAVLENNGENIEETRSGDESEDDDLFGPALPPVPHRPIIGNLHPLTSLTNQSKLSRNQDFR